MNVNIFLITDSEDKYRYLIWSDSEKDVKNYLPSYYQGKLAEVDNGQPLPAINGYALGLKKQHKIHEVKDFEILDQKNTKDPEGNNCQLVTIKYKNHQYGLEKNSAQPDDGELIESVDEYKKIKSKK